jgi:acetylglutamate kinase
MPKADTSAPILVRKYGGSSLENVERIKEIARDIAQTRRQGFQMVIVVSAMGMTTNELAALAHEASGNPPRRELDMLLSVGERITMSLLSMALAEEGCPAISFTGSQCGIITDTSHTDARILEVKGDRVRQSLAQGFTVVVAGFQGVSREKEITTLGRGGSDTTAVALAAALGAVRCEILKDVDGVMSADPACCADSWQHSELDSDQMLDIASTGCGVVHVRAVEYAAQHGVELVVRSSFHQEAGTVIHPRGIEPCPAAPASMRENRYRPLAMSVHRNVLRLSLAADDPALGRTWRDLALQLVDPPRIIAEWMDSGPDFRWEILGPREMLRPLVDELTRQDAARLGKMVVQEDLTCLSFAGGRPDSWLEVQRHVAELLEDMGCADWRLRADGTALRVLFSGEVAPDLPNRLHRSLLPD